MIDVPRVIGLYWCHVCGRRHRGDSKIGRNHASYLNPNSSLIKTMPKGWARFPSATTGGK